ncbi:peptidoglycan bridge formation glycyltransferase FemA/FemB family protein [Floccifex sp.]|uniref:peptidoglycan bridge formation glycyltransferase FemA/FemB family protein n=1 Tax=Floccifex sp. TaxID=2815810 RepID=UPI003F0F7930
MIFLDKTEYEKIMETYDQRNFLQSSFEGEKMKYDGWDVYYLVLENKKAICMCCIKPLMKVFGYAYIPRGFNYKDLQSLDALIQECISFCRKKKVIYMEMDPYEIYKIRDENGECLKTIDSMISFYESKGFFHLKMKKGYNPYKQCRWMSVLDIRNHTKEELFQSFSAKTRQNIKNTEKTGIQIRELQFNELHILKEMVDKSALKQDFSSFPLSYYEEQYTFFKDHAKAYYAYLDMEAYIQKLEKEKEKETNIMNQAISNLELKPFSKNSIQRLNIAQSHLQALEKRLTQALMIEQEKGKELPLAAGMFVFYGKEVIYLASGSNESYKSFKASYALQWKMIQQTMQEDYDFYNFYGISGYFQPDEQGYGVFDFKRGFKPNVIELIGNFIYPVHKTLYKIYSRFKQTD